MLMSLCVDCALSLNIVNSRHLILALALTSMAISFNNKMVIIPVLEGCCGE